MKYILGLLKDLFMPTKAERDFLETALDPLQVLRTKPLKMTSEERLAIDMYKDFQKLMKKELK